MKTTVLILLSFVSLVFALTASADCSVPEGANTTWCQSCGNLEQNVSRGLDLAWNKLLSDQRMQLELRVFGSTTLYLTDPPHSSHGVLYYTVVIEDPQFTVTNTETYAEAATLMNQYALGLNFEGVTPHIEFQWRHHVSQRIEQAVSMSVSTGSAPYTMRLFDSRGNAVAGGTIEQPRQTPKQQLALAGPRDLNPDNRYRNAGCAHADSRYPGVGSDGGSEDSGNGSGGWEDPWWEWEEAWGGQIPHCVDDFTDPYGSGVICFYWG